MDIVFIEALRIDTLIGIYDWERRAKQPVVLDNRVGAVGKIAAEHVAKSAPDGYTVLAGATTVIAANPALFKSLSYNPRTDFEAVVGLGTIPQVVVVHPSIPAKTMAEFVAYAKQNPGKLFYASSGPHFRAENFRSMTVGVGRRFRPQRHSWPNHTGP